MYKKFVFLQLVLTLFKITTQNDEEQCNINVSHQKANNLVIQNGKLTDTWESNPYKAYPEAEIDYFYTLQIINPDIKVPSIEVKIITNDTKIANPSASLSDQNNIMTTQKITQKTIEVQYHCVDGKKGTVHINMTITVHGCPGVPLTWYKVCRPFDHLPTVNIGTSPDKYEIIRNGKFVQEYMTNIAENSKKVTFPKDVNVLKLFIKYAKPGKSVTMGKPVITYDSVEMSPFFFGTLADGGRIGNEPQLLEVHLICLAYRKKVNDLEIVLTFNEYDSVRLTIRKECDTIGEIQEYFTILYVIYWILLILIIVFLIAILLYYMKKNEITFNDIIEKTVETCKALFNNEKKKQHRPTNLKEELYEENDLIDIKITTNKLNNNSTPINRQGNSSSYGGI